MPESKYKNLIYFALVIALFAYTFFYAKYSGQHETIPEAIGRHRLSIGIAISDLKYELSGGRGFTAIRDILSDYGVTKNPEKLKKFNLKHEEALKNIHLLNSALDKAIRVEKNKLNSVYFLEREDFGLVNYYKFAFSIFGYRVESFFYLYFSLLGISVATYLTTFYRRNALNNYLLLFLCSHFVVVSAAQHVGLELQTVHNPRFLPSLVYCQLYICRS